VLLLLLTALIFKLGLDNLKRRKVLNFWETGLSNPDPNALFIGGVMDNNSNDILWNAIIINMPQLLFSMLYFLYNGIITMMHTSHEWAAFTTKRKALRVSKPRGEQRSTYWLQLPWSYSVPLIVASGSLHWLLGRSTYMVKLDVYGYSGNREADKDISACGYSPLTILILIILLGIMALALVVLAMRRLESGATLVAINSLAIAAACHPDPREVDIATKPLMWGVVKEATLAEPGHCSFSSNEVQPLIEGAAYE
jgi:hypothetical protein